MEQIGFYAMVEKEITHQAQEMGVIIEGIEWNPNTYDGYSVVFVASDVRQNIKFTRTEAEDAPGGWMSIRRKIRERLVSARPR